MREWSVRVEVRGPEPLATGEDSIKAFLGQLADHGAALIGGPGSDTYGARLTIETHTADRAFSRGVELVRQAAAVAGLPDWPVVDAQVTAVDERDRERADPSLPELVGTSELAAILGVSRQRAHAVADRDDFPEPVAVLASGPVWTRPSVDRFVASRVRKPGRRSKADGDDFAARFLTDPTRFRPDPHVSDTVAPEDADRVVELVRNAPGERLHVDTIAARFRWERPRLSWVVGELTRTYRITYSATGWAQLRRCPKCRGDHITFKEIAAGHRRHRNAVIQGPPYCPDCGTESV